MWKDSTDTSLDPVTLKPDKWNSSECEISVIMHCRGRSEVFRIALQSLVATCSDLSAVEILVKVDSDDAAISEYLNVLKFFPFQHKLVIYDRLDAWWSVHIFETDLCRIANGSVLWLFNEDNEIVSGDWMAAFRQTRNVYTDNIYACSVPGVRPKVGKTVAPAFSREWFKVMNIVSPHVFSDRFLIRVAGGIGRLLSNPAMAAINFTHRAREKVLRPPLGVTKEQLTELLDRDVNRCMPLFKRHFGSNIKKTGEQPYKVYPPGTKVGPGYTAPPWPPGVG